MNINDEERIRRMIKENWSYTEEEIIDKLTEKYAWYPNARIKWKKQVKKYLREIKDV